MLQRLAWLSINPIAVRSRRINGIHYFIVAYYFIFWKLTDALSIFTSQTRPLDQVLTLSEKLEVHKSSNGILPHFIVDAALAFRKRKFRIK